jgi:hypothetical protein
MADRLFDGLECEDEGGMQVSSIPGCQTGRLVWEAETVTVQQIS